MEALTSSACTEKVHIVENVYYSSRYHIFAQSSLKIICTPLSHLFTSPLHGKSKFKLKFKKF